MGVVGPLCLCDIMGVAPLCFCDIVCRFTDKKLRALFDKFGAIVTVKIESKYGVAKVGVLLLLQLVLVVAVELS